MQTATNSRARDVLFARRPPTGVQPGPPCTTCARSPLSADSETTLRSTEERAVSCLSIACEISSLVAPLRAALRGSDDPRDLFRPNVAQGGRSVACGAFVVRPRLRCARA